MQHMPYAPLPAARLDIVAPPGDSAANQTIGLKLVAADGRPVAAQSDIHLRTTASNASLDKSEVVIEKGATSAEVTVSKTTPGIAEFSVEQVGGVTSAFSGSTQISFASDGTFVPKAPFVISLSVSPNTRLRTGLDTGTVVARLVDADQREFAARRTYTITFPELTGQVVLDPASLTILAGKSFGTLRVSASQPQVLPFRPSVVPPTTVQNLVSSLEFVSPIVSAVAIVQLPSQSMDIWKRGGRKKSGWL